MISKILKILGLQPRISKVFLNHSKHNCKQNDTYLRWKTNEFQSLILTPTWQNIGEWTVWIFVERSLVPRLFDGHNTKQGHSKGHYSVDENQELRIFELSYLAGRVHVLACHNFLLENTWKCKIFFWEIKNLRILEALINFSSRSWRSKSWIFGR